MRQFIQCRNRRDVASVARHRFERSNSPLTKQYFGIPVRRDVFRGHQQLFHRAAQSALQKHRSSAFSQRLQQHEILHVSRAHLHHIRVFRHQINVAVAHHFRDDRQPRRLLGLLQQFQSFFFHSLKIVRRSSRLERAAAQHFRARFRYALRRLHDLLFRLHRARAGHHHELVPANLRPVHANPRFLLAKLLAHKFIRGGDSNDFLHLRQRLYRFHARRHVAYPYHADHHALLPFDGVHLVSEVLYLLSNLVNFFPRRVQLHRNNHGLTLSVSFLVASEKLLQNKKNPLAASGPNLSFPCFAYRIAPRHLVGWNPKSKPIRVGAKNHAQSVFRLLPGCNNFFQPPGTPPNSTRASEKKNRNAIARETGGSAGAARSHRCFVARPVSNLPLNLFRKFARSGVSNRIIDLAPVPASPASFSQVFRASSLASAARTPIRLSKEATFCSCCSKLKIATACEKSWTANRPPVPRTAAIPTEVSRGSRMFFRWPGESIQPA